MPLGQVPHALPRRTFVAAATAAATALAVPSALAAEPRGAVPRRTAERGNSVIVRTTEGLISGERLGEAAGAVSVFRGVPYAAPPVGELRFASPRPPAPWQGVRDATRFALPSVQGDYVPESGEDCLYANVWTPDVKGARPVLVYIHGGGWMLGAGSEPDYDGARPAAHGDLVVINFNYRLGGLGWGLHKDLTDPETGGFANWGLQDQAALLRWVHRNAAAFGGDPGNITLAGTSAGGSSTWQLALLPELRGIIRRIIPISVKHVWEPASSMTPGESAEVYEHLARGFGTTVKGLRGVPARALFDAWEKVFSGSPTQRIVNGAREYRGPVVDGRWMRGFDYQLPTPDLPTMAIFGRTEGTFFTKGPGYPYPGKLPTNDAELRVVVRETLHKGAVKVSDEQVEEVITVYRRAAAAEGRPQDPVSLWSELWGDGLFRYQIVRLAERQARQSSAESYVMEFAHPVQPPYFGTPHEASSKFLFGSYALPQNAPAYGNGPDQKLVSDTFIELVASFARGQRPTSPHAPAWPTFAPGRPSALILGDKIAKGRAARVADLPKQAQLRYWDTAGWVPRP